MGKYQYQTNYEEAIKQGVSKEEYSREASKNCIQTWIANELAEANRLKRLELMAKFPPPEDENAKRVWLKSLEDQA